MFVAALKGAERKDQEDIAQQLASGSALGSGGGSDARATQLMRRVGVNQLRTFLESRIEECYRRNVAKIVPLLQNELRVSEGKLKGVEEQLNSLSIDRLRRSANLYRYLPFPLVHSASMHSYGLHETGSVFLVSSRRRFMAP
jgi:hypothetical protein